MQDNKKISENQRRFIEAVKPEPSKTMPALIERRANRALRKASAYIAIEVLMALDERGWSQAKLADALGVSPQQVSKWVRGKENFTLETIVKLERILGIRLLANDKKDSVFHRTKNLRSVTKEIQIHWGTVVVGFVGNVAVQARNTLGVEIQLSNKKHYTLCQPNKRAQVSPFA